MIESLNGATAEYELDVNCRTIKSLLSDNHLQADNNLPRNPGSGLQSRLGKLSIAILLASCMVCLGCVAFLTFLWEANTQNATWRSIVVSGWITRSITISALVLRWATTAQAILCTSMLSAVMLQIGAVPLPSAAAISIMRFDNTGPWSLLGVMSVQWPCGSLYTGLMALLLSLTTLCLQFTSTALLSQVGLADLPNEISVEKTYYGADPRGLTFGTQLSPVLSYLHTTPTGYPAFAEWVANATLSGPAARYGEYVPNNTEGIRDTGTVMRAFLPIRDPEERSRLTEYTGFGTVVDMRVVCLRPKFTDVVYSIMSGFRVTGLADIVQEPMGLRQTPHSNLTLSFDCPFSAVASKNRTEFRGWPMALCRPTRQNGSLEQGIYSAMNPTWQEKPGYSYILVNATMNESVTALDNSDVWESMTLRANDSETYTVSLQLTLCLSTFEAQELNIHATRHAPVIREPTLSWNISTAAYNTESVLRQLGAGGSSINNAERGIFNLAPRSWEWFSRPEFLSLSGGTWSTTSALENTAYANRMYSGMINDAQYSILAQMARLTRNPALALQAYLSNLCAIAYYDRITLFDAAAPSSQTRLVQVTRPLGSTGYIAVVSVLSFHLLIVLIIVITFYRAGKLSRIGNAWSAISQVLGPATEEWIRDADMADERTVKKWLKARDQHKTLVQVQDIDGRVQISYKDKSS